MGSDGAMIYEGRDRPPWLWLPVLTLAAAFATYAVFANARSRVAKNDNQFASSQQLRLQVVEIHMDDYFSKTIQLVSTGAAALAQIHGDAPTAERIVNELFASRMTPEIYGLGPSWEPGAFNGDGRLFCIYDLAGPHGTMHQYLLNPNATPYTASIWYRRAAETPGEVRFAGPYGTRRHSFISTVLGFMRDGRFAGVMTVDILTETFKNQYMAKPLAAGDIAWVESSRRGRWLLGTAPLTRGDRIDATLPLRYTGAFVHISSDASALHAEDRRTFTLGAALVAAIWLFAGLLGAGIIQYARSRQNARRLAFERAKLEREIALGKHVEAELRKAASTDALTGLPNRTAFIEQASAVIADGSRDCAVFFIDLDRFNLINETLGHPAGDDLLKIIGTRLQSTLSDTGWVARLGGDEFVVIAPIGEHGPQRSADEILAALRQPVPLDSRLVYSNASVGVVVIDPEYRQPEELLRDADIAMYAAKRRGRACAVIFDAAMRRAVAVESDLENDLRRAIERHEFVPYYQPIVYANSQAVASFEALVRWQRPGSGIVGASEFIAYAERRGIIDAIDSAMLEGVCRDAKSLFSRYPDATVGVNVSAVHLTAPNLAEAIDGVLQSHGVPPNRLKIEVTETAIMTDADRARETLEQLRDVGVRVLLDDFGAGYSSLSYLHRLPITGLKIDRSFVTHLPDDVHATAIVRGIVALADALGLDTVAEGVETEEQLEALRHHGVMFAQGFLFSAAVPLGDALQATVHPIRMRA